jgi:DNA polymerase-4
MSTFVTTYIVIVDANSAFLSWSAVSALQHGASIDLREIPSVVGGSQEQRHGIVLAKSIPAKKYGITTGEPLINARMKCPNLIIVPPDFSIYMQCSSAMIEILREYSDRVQVFSIDEGFLDYTGMEALFGDPIETAYAIKDRIKNELGFTVSIGVSSNKLLAKMGSDLKKPDAVTTLFPEEVKEKMWPLPVSDLYMVGRATTKKLEALGIKTIGELATFDKNILQFKFKNWCSNMLHDYANGIESSPVYQESYSHEIKGIGNSTTISFDVTNKHEAELVLLSLVESVSMRLRSAGMLCSVVSVSIRTNEFLSYGHQKKISTPTNCTNAIYEAVVDIFDEMWKGQPIRHLGVRVSELTTLDYVQLSLFHKNWDKEKRIDAAVDKIRMRYGNNSVFRSCFLGSGIAPLQGGVSDESVPQMTSIL